MDNFLGTDYTDYTVFLGFVYSLPSAYLDDTVFRKHYAMNPC